MTPREIADKIVRIASAANSGGEHPELYKKLVETAAELRAALPEQPLADDWLRSKIHKALNTYRFQHTVDEDGDSTLRMYDLLTPPGDSNVTRGKDEVFLLADYIASDLDAQHDEGRELLRRMVEAVDNFNNTRPEKMVDHVWALGSLLKVTDEARKHLGVESDEA